MPVIRPGHNIRLRCVLLGTTLLLLALALTGCAVFERAFPAFAQPTPSAEESTVTLTAISTASPLPSPQTETPTSAVAPPTNTRLRIPSVTPSLTPSATPTIALLVGPAATWAYTATLMYRAPLPTVVATPRAGPAVATVPPNDQPLDRAPTATVATPHYQGTPVFTSAADSTAVPVTLQPTGTTQASGTPTSSAPDREVTLNSATLQDGVLTVNFTLENIGSQSITVLGTDFNARYSDGQIIDRAFCQSAELVSEVVVAGDQIRGNVCWNNVTATTGIVIQYLPDSGTQIFRWTLQ